MINPYLEKTLQPKDTRTTEEHAEEGVLQSERMIKAWQEDWALIIEPFAVATKMSLSEALLFFMFQQVHASRVMTQAQMVREHEPWHDGCEHCQRAKEMYELSREYMRHALRELKGLGGDEDKWRPLP